MAKSLILSEILRHECGVNDLWSTGYRARLLYELTSVGKQLPEVDQLRQSAEYQDGWLAASAWLADNVERKCPMCDRPVTGSALKIYCSDACRQQAYRERKG